MPSCFTHVARRRLRILSDFLRLVQTIDRVTRGEGQIIACLNVTRAFGVPKHGGIIVLLCMVIPPKV